MILSFHLFGVSGYIILPSNHTGLHSPYIQTESSILTLFPTFIKPTCNFKVSLLTIYSKTPL